MFELHPRLAADTIELGDLPLCRVLLMNDMHYPWIILVPRQQGLREIHELGDEEQIQLIRESSFVSRKMSETLSAKKMNVAALGNMVPQLHVHHIARYENDAAWPAPVWGKHPAEPYGNEMRSLMCDRLRNALCGNDEIPMQWREHQQD